MFISVNSIAFAIAPSAVGTVFLIVKYSFLRISILSLLATSLGIFPAIIFLSAMADCFFTIIYALRAR